MAKKKKETKIEEKKPELKKYNTFQIGLIVLLTITILTLCGVLLVQKIGIYLDARKTMNEFNELYEGEEPSVIFYMSTNCVYCEMQQPILDQIAKDYDIDYLKIDKMNLSEKNLREIEEKLGLDGATPATVIVKDGEVVTGNTGYLDGYEYIKIFIDGGILDEGSKYKPEENLTFIDYQQFLELVETNEPVAITLGRAACDYCTAARPILSNISKAYDVPLYYLTLNYIPAEDRLALVDKLEEMDYDEEVFVKDGDFVTPATLIIEDGKVVSYQRELGNINIYTKLFKDYGIIE